MNEEYFDDIDNITAEGYALKSKIDLLRSQEAKANNGRGVTCVWSILSYIDCNDWKSAKRVFETDGDKVHQYPEIEETLVSLFGCRMHGNRSCVNTICCSLRNQNLTAKKS